MKKYQVLEVQDENNTAGSKATLDALVIAEQEDFETKKVLVLPPSTSFFSKLDKQIKYMRNWNQIYQSIEDDSIVFLQNPFHYVQAGRKLFLSKLKKEKHGQVISLVHDVEELRKFMFNSYYHNEFETMMRVADVLIVHNARMKSFFVKKGFPKDHIVILGIFDYLTTCISKRSSQDPFQRLMIAGNLNAKKSGYLSQLNRVKNVAIDLYGPNFNPEEIHGSTIQYHGVVPSEKLPGLLPNGFGLVWDGSEINTCAGDAGEYLRYNNPHKLSLFLAAGIPVVIWKEAAEAEFVLQNQVGYAVESLQEAADKISECSQSDYDELLLHVSQIQKKLITGYYLRNAMEAAQFILVKDREA